MYTRNVIIKINIPFCIKKCPHCQRAVIPGWNSSRLSAYMEAVCTEIKANADQFGDCRIIGVRFGGGTASIAGRHIAEAMRCLKQCYTVSDDVYVTMRASIADISGATMPFFKRAGVDRFDFEMMSLNPFDFSRLNQTASLNDLPIVCDHFLHAYANDTLGMVLAYGHPAPESCDTIRNFRRSVLAFTRSNGSHLTLQRYRAADAISSDMASRQLTEGRKVLDDHGFSEYAPLRFARRGCEDRNVLARLSGIEELGFGLGAHTRIEGAHSINTTDLTVYLEASDDYAAITASVEALSDNPALYEKDSWNACSNNYPNPLIQ